MLLSIQYVSTYLKEEIENNFVLGSFTEPPIKNLHTSPFMSREKLSSVNRRFIIDLSWPIGNSVNSGASGDRYLDIEFILTYPSIPIDNITHQVLKLRKSCEVFKVDISRAFCHVPIDPGRATGITTSLIVQSHSGSNTDLSSAILV